MARRKKRKFKFKKFLLFLLVVVLFGFLIINLFNYKVKNIYITGNSIYSDQEIIDILKLNDSTFLLTTKYKLNKNSKDNKLIKNIVLKKEIPSTFKIEIEEYYPYFLYQDSYYIEGDSISKDKITKDLIAPILTTTLVATDLSKLHKAFEKIDKEVVLKISEIEYSPTEYDNERFLFIMTDGNYSYVSILNIDNINYYNKIVTQLEGKKSILYFDSYRDTDAGIITEILE